MPTAAAATLSTKPVEFAYVATHIGVHAWVFPTNTTQTVFCARLPVGASISIDLGSYEQRGSFNPIPSTNPLGFVSYPTTLMFFGAVGGDTTADITYINTFGTF